MERDTAVGGSQGSRSLQNRGMVISTASWQSPHPPFFPLPLPFFPVPLHTGFSSVAACPGGAVARTGGPASRPCAQKNPGEGGATERVSFLCRPSCFRHFIPPVARLVL